MPNHDEQAIIAAVRAGERDRYRILVERHHDTLYGVLVRLLADPTAAAELTQEAFVRAYSGLGGFRSEARFSTWLVQIGIHLARDEVRRRQRSRGVVSLDERLDEMGAAAEPAYEGDGADPLEGMCSREREKTLLAAIEQLPASYREVLTLRYFSEWSFAEISAQTGDSVGTLKVRAHRARSMLRDLLSGPDDEYVAHAAGPTLVRRAGEGNGR
jgi:RNA polymerase sigma-70 factor (ECF subfamily)